MFAIIDVKSLAALPLGWATNYQFRVSCSLDVYLSSEMLVWRLSKTVVLLPGVGYYHHPLEIIGKAKEQLLE